ncbi:unnamed protein product [Phytomonas sp. EM1]|nr:unnamed protein product [Phytomonas sp. EM1]|eukprot:CCW62940.1 unnamed protein product [Phytomonas sp. isolate EM1]
MTMRHRGLAYKALLPRLPRNLVVFDGHCLLSQARVRYVLERNFNYLSIPSYLLGYTQDTGLERHRIYFTSFSSLEGNELKRLFFPISNSLRKTPSTGTSTSSLPLSSQPSRLPDDLVILFVEKVPSRNASLLHQAGGHRAHEDRNAALFAPASSNSSSSSSTARFYLFRDNRPRRKGDPQMDAGTLIFPEDTDLLVSTNFSAMCRIGMHLDRIWLRIVFRVLYSIIPRRLGDAWFERVVSRRRKLIWGTSEEDAVTVPGAIDGMKERRWSWHKRYAS